MKKAFKVKEKAFFIIFEGLLFTKNCLGPESAPLTHPFPMHLFSTLLKTSETLKVF